MGDLYSLTCDVNPYGPLLVKLVGLDIEWLVKNCRFRDAYPTKDRLGIVIFTRIGGGNRSAYKHAIYTLQSKDNYVKDEDWDFDSTYAEFTFRIPQDKLPQFVAYFSDADTKTGPEKMKESMDWIERDADGFTKAHPEYDKQMRRIFEQINNSDDHVIFIGDNDKKW